MIVGHVVALVRTRADVESTLKNAKLEPDELHATAQCLIMSAEMDNEAMKLIELDNSLLDSLLAGNWLVITHIVMHRTKGSSEYQANGLGLG